MSTLGGGSGGRMTDSFYFVAASCSSLTRSLRFNNESPSDQSELGDYCKIKSSSAVMLDVENHP